MSDALCKSQGVNDRNTHLRKGHGMRLLLQSLHCGEYFGIGGGSACFMVKAVLEEIVSKCSRALAPVHAHPLQTHTGALQHEICAVNSAWGSRA